MHDRATFLHQNCASLTVFTAVQGCIVQYRFFNTFIFTFILIYIYIYISDIVSPFSGSVTAILALTLK